jgi:tripartite-type tricarboxylate transporter receptor subunit TctC
VVVENKAGASGTIGNNFVAKATPDGYTVLVAITALIQQQSLMDKLPYDPLKDFAPVTLIARSPSMFAVPLDSPAKSLKEFVAMAKANPGKSATASAGHFVPHPGVVVEHAGGPGHGARRSTARRRW